MSKFLKTVSNLGQKPFRLPALATHALQAPVQNFYRDFLYLTKIAKVWLRLPRSCHDVCEFSNLGEIAARFSKSRQDLAEMFDFFQISVRSRQECTEILKDTNKFPRFPISR